MPRTSQSRTRTRRIPATLPRRRPVAPVVSAATLGAALLAGAVLSRPGAAVCHQIYEFVEYYSGVFSLVALSITVMGGIAATERTVLRPHHRVQLQVVHRAMAALAMGFLAVHIATKVIESHAHAVDVVVPFLADHRRAYVGLGTVAAYLMVIATWTGLARSRFAGSARVWSWRLLHSAAYICWPVALVHGLESGRAAKAWVLVSYALCLILVAAALAVRLAATLTRRASGPRARTTGEIRATRRSRDALAAVDEWPSGPVPPAPIAPASPAFGYPAAPAPPRTVPVSPAPRPRRESHGAPRHDAPTPPFGQRALAEHMGEAAGRDRPRPPRPEAAAEPPRPVDPMSDTLSRDSSDEEFLAFLRGTGAR